MTDLYLKAEDAAAMDAALLSIGLIDGDGKPAKGVDLDRIGTISRITGRDDDGEPIVTTHVGYHANVRTAFDLDEAALEAIEPLIVETPETPYRVWG
jgi:hypothetical protein